MSKTPKKKIEKEGFKKLLGLFRYILPYKTYFIFGLFCLLISSTLLLAFPYLTGELIDASSGDEALLEHVNEVGLILGCVLLVQALFSFLRIVLFGHVVQKALADLRRDLFGRILYLPVYFFDRNRTGDLISRLTNDITILQDAFGTTLAELIRQTLTLLIGIIALLYFNTKLTLFMLATFPLLALGAMIFGRFIRKMSKKVQGYLAETNVVVEDSLSSIRMVKAYTSEKVLVTRYRTLMDSVVNLAIKTAYYRGGFVSFIVFGLFGGIVLVLWYGSRMMALGEIEVGQLISFIIYTMFIGGSVAGLGDIYSNIQKAVGASEKVRELLDEPMEPDSESQEDSNLNPALSFEKVSFSYPARLDVPVLNEVSFGIKKGEQVALIGQSGSGKTTVTQLILKFYEQFQGEISFGDVPLKNISSQVLRRNIGLVPQDVALFGGTIAENILFGSPDATEADIISACKQANAWEFIEAFPEKLNTLVGEKGVQLSGGQRQRIAIARAILKNPSFLILDEATSSLDAQSEQLVQEALDRLMKNRTTLVIAHRLSTIRNADRIIVLEKGRLIETGDHYSLMENPEGYYRHYLNLQGLEV
jgi:ABC-type multidrug transport system fused ATPase/permease subunit